MVEPIPVVGFPRTCALLYCARLRVCGRGGTSFTLTALVVGVWRFLLRRRYCRRVYTFHVHRVADKITEVVWIWRLKVGAHTVGLGSGTRHKCRVATPSRACVCRCDCVIVCNCAVVCVIVCVIVCLAWASQKRIEHKTRAANTLVWLLRNEQDASSRSCLVSIKAFRCVTASMAW